MAPACKQQLEDLYYLKNFLHLPSIDPQPMKPFLFYSTTEITLVPQFPLKAFCRSQWEEDLMGKSACLRSSIPGSHGGRRELTPDKAVSDLHTALCLPHAHNTQF